MEILTKEDTIDNGLIEQVHIAPIGDFVGSDSSGNPVPEKMSVDSLTRLADKLNASDEVLCDIDHGAAKKGAEKQTSAAGWFTRFVVDPIKGMFAMLKLTKKGKELLQNREYRYTSPTFILDGNGEPIDLHSVSLTNVPAFKGYINPILNTEASETEDKGTIKMEMTKEELVTLIKDTVVALNAAPAEVKEEEKEEVCNAEETKAEEVETEEVKTEEAPVENACAEEVKNETAAEETEVEETKEETAEVKEETKKEEPKKEEIIKIEALNSAPAAGTDISGKSAWQNLHGDAFWKYLQDHPEVK